MVQVRRQDGFSKTLQLERPVRSVPSPVNSFLEDRGGRQVSKRIYFHA